jgi:hypothetical protein
MDGQNPPRRHGEDQKQHQKQNLLTAEDAEGHRGKSKQVIGRRLQVTGKAKPRPKTKPQHQNLNAEGTEGEQRESATADSSPVGSE